MELDELLNKNQKEAATYLDSHLRIIAGAGSGKTRVVTYRIAYLIDEIGVDPRKILAITFTNKAANEMKERITSLLGPHALGSLVCTIHSLCVRILRRHINVINYPSNFMIMDEEDQKALIKKIYNNLDIDAKTISIKSMIASISNYKMANIDPERAMELAGQFQGEIKKAKVYKEYLEYQENHFMLDFDDLLLKAVYIFENYPDVLEKWQHKFQYIHVDEFQDVGNIEYRLVKLMSQDAITCVVGDPDQTIYSFRGANVNYILDFDKDFKPCKTVILDQNYRSTGNILNISNSLIRKNRNRLEKDLYTEATGGSEVIHYMGKSEQEEADYICSQIEKIISEVDGVNYRDFAILYRANYLSRTIEQSMISHGIDYRIFGGLKFFSRKEVKDALSYLQLVCNDEDLAFERIINVPARGIGKKTLENIQLVALNNQVSLDDESYNFSFSGLKSAVINLNHKAMQRNEEINQEDLAASFQDVVLSVLVNKTIRATKEYGIKQVLMAGGVSANRGLRNAMGEAVGQLDGVELLLPPMSCCTDNAMMIALAAKQMYDLKLFSDLSLGIKPNLDLENESVSGGNQNG